MKIRTALVAPLAATMLLVGAPAYSADEPVAPATCEETVNEYRNRLDVLTATLAASRAEASTLRTDLALEKVHAAKGWAVAEEATADNARLEARSTRMKAKIASLWDTVRKLRNR